MEEIEDDEPDQISDVDASRRAAQIYAEMLGLICHPDYYKAGDQIVKTNVRYVTVRHH